LYRRKLVLKNNEKIEIDDIDIRNYIKYILREESILEKRELLSCLKDKLVLKDGKITVLN